LPGTELNADIALAPEGLISTAGSPRQQVPVVEGLAVLSTLIGTEGDDFLVDWDVVDEIHALGGNDIVHALDGGDTVYGGDGNDLLFGESSDDFVDGGNGNDEGLHRRYRRAPPTDHHTDFAWLAIAHRED
jgi:hypothetical protein